MGAALHFDTWVPNFGIQEYMRHAPETDEVFPHDYVFRDGRLHCGETPGHGVTIDEKLAAKYPYNPKQLPDRASRRRHDVGLVRTPQSLARGSEVARGEVEERRPVRTRRVTAGMLPIGEIACDQRGLDRREFGGAEILLP